MEDTAAFAEAEFGDDNRPPFFGTGTHLWVIALTARAMKGDCERCMAAGMDGYLSKPIRPSELDEMLQNHLNRRMESAIKAQSREPLIWF